jgi:DMSO/TMAO reductase YedYZ heme-binding membrane subunit
MERLSIRVTSVAALAIVLAVDLLYVVLIKAQGGSPDPYVPFVVATYLAVMAALIAIAMIPRPGLAAMRVPLRVAAALGLLALGFLAIFSIGVPLMVAAILVIVSLFLANRAPRPEHSESNLPSHT